MEPIKLNREQKRAYKRKHAHDKYAHYCPHCKMNTVWTLDEEKKNICCEICGNIILRIPEENDNNGTVSGEEVVVENSEETIIDENT